MAGDDYRQEPRNAGKSCRLTIDLPDPWTAFGRMAREPFFFLQPGTDGGWRVALRPVQVEILRPGNDVTSFLRIWERLTADAQRISGQEPETGPLSPIIGILGFEAGAWFEPFPRRDRIRRSFPDGVLLLYDLFLDWQDGIARITSFGPGRSGQDAGRARRRARALLTELKRASVSPRPVPAGLPAGSIAPIPPRGGYARMVEGLRREIARGDLFQANLAWPWRVRLHPRDQPFALFRRLVEASPAGHSALLRLRKDVLISNSPELFLATARAADGSIRAHALPIKGTARRAAEAGHDRHVAEALVASEKDRAENRMIVDLMRNDFSRVARIGSVAVPEMFGLRTLPNVHHLVSRIEATLAPGNGPAELMAACFPPGSVTGAPKPAALKAIARHERYRRGPWCGTLFRTDGRGELIASVLIRSLVLTFHRRSSSWRGNAFAGAGITILSDPIAEKSEIEAKMQMIAGAVRARTARRMRRP